MTKSILLVQVIALLALACSMVCAEVRNGDGKNKVPIDDVDVEVAKERWMEEDWGDTDLLQHPIDEGPRRVDRVLGDLCTYSRDCASGCCLLDRPTKIRSCQPKATKGEKCSNAQVKADTFVDACPCEAGYGKEACDDRLETCGAHTSDCPDFCTFPGEVCSK